MPEPESYELLQRYEAGESEAARAIFDRYVQRLVELVRSRINAKLGARLDPEDIVQSAYRSFFVHASNGEYLLGKSGDLWRLLVGITLHKLYGQIEKHTASKRSIYKHAPGEVWISDVTTADPGPAEIVAVFEELSLALRSLSGDERIAVTLALNGSTIEQIGDKIGKSSRTVRRLLARAESTIEKRLLSEQRSEATQSMRTQSWLLKADAPLKYSDYILEKLLGSGGMGKVYRAVERSSGKIVALKALHKSLQHDERSVVRFVEEARILAKLQHPNIVRILGLGRFPIGSFFIVMQLVDGTDVQTELVRGRFTIPDALHIVRQVADAIQHAHEHGVIHCDLKPANVVVDSSNKAVVTDFGFAFVTSGRTENARAAVGGTRGYIAPEVLRGGVPTVAADVYGIGALLWAMLVGRPPESDADLTQTNVPARIAAVCARCLASRPEDRFGTVGELNRELEVTV
jgi:RNA polymerase sigma factor (sigma-70 family)